MAYDKAIDSAELDADLTSIADAIRAKGGTTEALSFPDGFVSAVEGIQAGGGGDDSMLNAVLDGTIIEFTNTELTGLTNYALSSKPLLKKVVLPNVTSIGSASFQNCSVLEYVDISGFVGQLPYSVFENDTKLKTVKLGEITGLTRLCFASCTSLEEFVSESFKGFYQDYTFRGCTALKRIIVPNNTTVLNNGNIQNCTSLEEVDIGFAPQINANSYSTNPAIKKIVLRKTTVASLGNVNAFTGTQFAEGGTGGVVYVPSALISAYQTATNWSTLYAAGTCNFVAIEGSEYE